MPAKRRKTVKKDKSWDSIGKDIGSKIDKASKEGKFDDCCKSWNVKKDCGCNGGFFGRLLFVIGVVWALSTLGHLDGVSAWAIALIIVGFAFLKF